VSQKSIQAALGVPLNYTEVMESVNQVFVKTGDMHRGGRVEEIGLVLSNGIKVAMLYGDRDAVRKSLISNSITKNFRHVIGSEVRQ
jgi:hypothetical protein